MKASEVLLKYGWCQGHLARTKTGLGVLPDSRSAVEFCALGAIDKAYSRKRNTLKRMLAEKKLAQYLAMKFGDAHISTWNDEAVQTKEEVIEVLKFLDI